MQIGTPDAQNQLKKNHRNPLYHRSKICQSAAGISSVQTRTSISNATGALTTLEKLPQSLHPVLIDRHSTSMHKRHQHGSRIRTQIGLSTSTDQKPADKMLKSITRSLRRAISNAPCRTPASQACMASLHRRPASPTCLTDIFAPLPLLQNHWATYVQSPSGTGLHFKRAATRYDNAGMAAYPESTLRRAILNVLY